MERYLRIGAVVALVLAFGASGIAKLVDPAAFRVQFVHFGLPEWWVTVTAAVELLGAALVALPGQKLRRAGAALLAATMAVATALHLLHDPAAQAVPAALLMLLAGFVALDPPGKGGARALAGA